MGLRSSASNDVSIVFLSRFQLEETANQRTSSLPSDVAYIADVRTETPASNVDLASFNHLLCLSSMRVISLVEAALFGLQKVTRAYNPQSQAWKHTCSCLSV